MIEKLKNIPYWIYDTLSVVSGIVTIITAIIASIKAILVIKELEDHTYVISCDKILIFICVLLFLITIVCVIKVKKYGTVLRNVKQEFPYNYYMFLHDFRNAYFDILRKHKNNKNQDKNSRIEMLTKDTQTFLENALDYLCSIMEKNTGRKVSACIKLIENTGNATNINKDTATVITFCRSKNSDLERKSKDISRKDSIYIKYNTDFYDILDEKKNNALSCFYQSDLVQYDKYLRKQNEQYLNTTPNYQKYYRGTIVAPIRIARERLHYLEEKTGYDIVGFLCVDSPYTDAFRNNKDDKNNNSRIVKSFAAEMYIILNKYNFYLTKINGGK